MGRGLRPMATMMNEAQARRSSHEGTKACPTSLGLSSGHAAEPTAGWVASAVGDTGQW